MPESGAALRVLFIYYEPGPSGQTEHVLTLAQRQDRARIDVTVVLPDLLNCQVALFEAAGARVIILPIRKLILPYSALSGLCRLIRQGD